MITCDLLGRTGNQVIQIAATIAQAHRLGVEYKIPTHSLNQEQWPLLFNQFPTFTPEDHSKIRSMYTEPQDFTYSPIPMQDGLRLRGYWQSELHFRDYRKEILQAFNFSLYEDSKGYVAIHVRRTDFVHLADKHPPVTKEYLFKAIEFFNQKGYNKFLVFSDDIAWCKEVFRGQPHNVFWYSMIDDTLEALYQMASCDHQIIANSTYSWVAAWFNQNENKIVVSPSKDNWFGPGNRHLKTDWIIPESWHQIKY